jgi:hypothetical protein
MAQPVVIKQFYYVSSGLRKAYDMIETYQRSQ